MSESDKPGQAGGNSWNVEQWHEVVAGDTLSKLSKQYYGDASLYMKIFEASRNVLNDPNLIKVGQKLRIP